MWTLPMLDVPEKNTLSLKSPVCCWRLAWLVSKRDVKNRVMTSNMYIIWVLPNLKLTANAPENRPGPKRKRSYSNHPFPGASCWFQGG